MDDDKARAKEAARKRKAAKERAVLAPFEAEVEAIEALLPGTPAAGRF
jgi:hypothetical protein